MKSCGMETSISPLESSRCLAPHASDLDSTWLQVLVARLAQRLEAAAYQAHALPAYRRKIRFLATALQRPEGHALLRQALWSEPLAAELARRPEEDFLAPAQRARRLRHQREAMAEARRP